jgi:hypothetical protein
MLKKYKKYACKEESLMKWNILRFSYFGVSSVVSRSLNLKYNSLRWKANKGVNSFSKCSKSFKGLKFKH